jgi:hypothetical protein
MKKLERVAKAIWTAHHKTHGHEISPPFPTDTFQRELWLLTASAAIEALGESPSQAMRDGFIDGLRP